MSGIRDDPLVGAVVRELARVWGDRLAAVVVSGSWVAGDATTHSDVDLDCVVTEGSFRDLAFVAKGRVIDISGGSEAGWARVATTPGRAWVLGDWSTWGNVTLYGDGDVGDRLRAAIDAVPQSRFDDAAAALVPELASFAGKIASAQERDESAAARWAALEAANTAAAIVALVNRRATGKSWARHLNELLRDADVPAGLGESYRILTTGHGSELLDAARRLEDEIVAWLPSRGVAIPAFDRLNDAERLIRRTTG